MHYAIFQSRANRVKNGTVILSSLPCVFVPLSFGLFLSHHHLSLLLSHPPLSLYLSPSLSLSLSSHVSVHDRSGLCSLLLLWEAQVPGLQSAASAAGLRGHSRPRSNTDAASFTCILPPSPPSASIHTIHVWFAEGFQTGSVNRPSVVCTREIRVAFQEGRIEERVQF